MRTETRRCWCPAGTDCDLYEIHAHDKAAQDAQVARVRDAAGELLDAVGVIGWGSGDAYWDALRWLTAVAEERGLTDPPADTLTPPRKPLPEEFEPFRKRLPVHGHHVYVLLDANGVALYVGQSVAPRSRIRTHWRRQQWWPDVADIALHPVPNETAARLLERNLTDSLRPAHSRVTGPELALLERLLAGQKG